MSMDRNGTIRFGDACIDIWENPNEQVMGPWERQFKKDVFKRVVQQLNRLGWTCIVPPEMIEDYSLSFARNHRYCRKGDLEGLLDLCGRHIEFKMWQNVTNVENPNGGRYDSNKEERMPYLLRLEMERTRIRLRNYLCNVFSGYEFASERNDGRSQKRGPRHLTAYEWIQGCYETSWHFKGDPSTYRISECNSESADGEIIRHGDRVWFADSKGRICTGIAYYNINNMWWVQVGKYDVSNEAAFKLYKACPTNPRQKRNERLRRRRLEQELARAIKAMDFMRAQTLKQVLFPEPVRLFMVYHKGHGAYHGPNFSGYTVDPASAGKFTEAELGGYAKDDHNKVIPVQEAS